MGVLSSLALSLLLPFLPQIGAIQDPVQARFTEAIASSSSDGISTTIRKLDDITASAPASPTAARAQEFIQSMGILHPGSVPDRAVRLQTMRRNAPSIPEAAKILIRLELADRYYAEAAQGRAEGAAAALSDASLDNSLIGLSARADAALRLRDYPKAEALAFQVIEANPHNPLLAGAWVILGLCDTYRGNAAQAAEHFQKSMTISSLPTLYGETRELLRMTYRFARPTPGIIGKIFDSSNSAQIPEKNEIKDHRTLKSYQNDFLLVDREQILIFAADGTVKEVKAAKKLADAAIAPNGKIYFLTEDGLDAGTGVATPLTVQAEGKFKPLKKPRSLIFDAKGIAYILDMEFGLFSCDLLAGGSLAPKLIAPVPGRLLRMDSHGRFFILSEDRRSINVLSPEGKRIASLLQEATDGKQPEIEAFALDSFNHLYTLDEASIQIFTLTESGDSLDKTFIGAISTASRDSLKELKVLAVSPTGELATTGKNDNNWVIFQ